jgi:Fe-only nitrogenase accessory protein AnfO
MEIAVLVDSEGKTTGFENNGMIRIYIRTEERWIVKKQLEYDVTKISDGPGLRREIKTIIAWMENCKLFVVNRIRGVHYIAFEEYQVSLLEITGIPESFLEDIRECVEHRRTGQEIPLEHNAIYEMQPGSFHTDLRDVMHGNTSYNSKQLLIPFIKGRKFNSLEIICEHIPKWLEKEAGDMGVVLSVEKFKDCMKVKVYQVKSR